MLRISGDATLVTNSGIAGNCQWCKEAADFQDPEPTNSEVPGHTFTFLVNRSLVSENSAVIDTVMRHVNVHIDCHLISCCASLYRASGEPTLAADVCQSASRTRRNCGDAVAHHRAHNTMHQPQHGGGWRRRFCVAPVPRCQSDRLHKPQVPRCRYFTA